MWRADDVSEVTELHVGRDAMPDPRDRKPPPQVRGSPRPWRAGAIALGLLGVALLVAWFIYRRSVTYDLPRPARSQRRARHRAAATIGAPPELVTYGSIVARGGSAGSRCCALTGDAHADRRHRARPAARAADLAAVVHAAAGAVDLGDRGRRRPARRHDPQDARLAWRWRFVDDGMVEADRRMAAGLTRGAAASGVDLSAYDDAAARPGRSSTSARRSDAQRRGRPARRSRCR